MIELEELTKKLLVAQLPPNSEVDQLALLDLDFVSITKTDKEISVITYEEDFPQNLESIAKVEKDWVGFRVKGTLEFNQYGILSSLLEPLAKAKISVFVFSTYDTDYIMVKSKDAGSVKAVLAMNFKE